MTPRVQTLLMLVVFALGVMVAVRALGREPVEVDVQIVLATDVSISVSEAEHELQVEGMAKALESDEIAQVFDKLMTGRIAVVYHQWAAESHTWAGEWTLLSSPAEARAYAASLRAAKRSGAPFSTHVHKALDDAQALIAASPYKALRSVIDIATDGIQTRFFDDPANVEKLALARASALARGITINAITIGGTDQYRKDVILVDWYRAHVIGGPGAFAVEARDFQDFGPSFKRKLLLEIG